MSSEKELTPEEKLLALIQKDKRPEPAADSERPREATVAPTASAAIPVPPPLAAAVPPATVVPAGVSPARGAENSASSPVKTDVAAPSISVPAAPVAADPVRPVVAGERGAAAPAAVTPEAGSKLKLAAAPPMSSAKSQWPGFPAREPPAAIEKSAAQVAAPLERPARAVPSTKALRLSVNSLMSWPILNRILALVVLVLLVVVVYSIASVQVDIDKAMASQVNQAGALPVQPVGIEAMTPLPVDEYLQKVSGRDIFRLAEVTGPVSNVAPPAVEFRLVGVSLDGRDPKGSMAILRNKASSQTFFVKVGDALDNTGFTLDRVLADRAILKKQKQEIEVR